MAAAVGGSVRVAVRVDHPARQWKATASKTRHLTLWKVTSILSIMETHDPESPPRPDSDTARQALKSIEMMRRRRLAVITSPQWVFWGIGICMVLAGLAYLLAGWERLVAQLLVLAAIFALSLAAQRSSGMVTRLTRPPARPLRVWIGFVAIVAGAVWLTNAAARGGEAPLGFFALAALCVTLGPGLNQFWRRAK